MTPNHAINRPGRELGVLRSAATGAVVLELLFLACWLGAAWGIGGVHTYIALFTTAPAASSAALVAGLCISLVVGALIGAVTAASYAAFAMLDRR